MSGAHIAIITPPELNTRACELCGVVAELRPYGPKGESICFDCGIKDERSTNLKILDLLGVPEDEREEALKNAPPMKREAIAPEPCVMPTCERCGGGLFDKRSCTLERADGSKPGDQKARWVHPECRR